MIKITSSGSTKNLERFLTKAQKPSSLLQGIALLAEEGVQALAHATPSRTGATANAWGYEIVQKSGAIEIWWTNTNVHEDQHIAVLIQYGHGLANGGWVQGRDYINPALQPIFDKISQLVKKEVSS